MIVEETEAKFTCTATTDPEEIQNLEILWKKDGEFIDYELAQRIFRNNMDNSLTISGTISLDTGKYTCVAQNGLDSDEKSAQLVVQGRNWWGLKAGMVVGMGSANERRRYIVTSSYIGWAQNQNDLCETVHCELVHSSLKGLLLWCPISFNTLGPTKWPPFCRRYFQMHFLEWKFMNLA